MTESEKVMAVIGIVFAALGVIFFSSCLTTGLWFCFDDALARITGVEALGTVSFWNVYPFTFFVSGLFKAVLHKPKER